MIFRYLYIKGFTKRWKEIMPEEEIRDTFKNLTERKAFWLLLGRTDKICSPEAHLEAHKQVAKIVKDALKDQS